VPRGAPGDAVLAGGGILGAFERGLQFVGKLRSELRNGSVDGKHKTFLVVEVNYQIGFRLTRGRDGVMDRDGRQHAGTNEMEIPMKTTNTATTEAPVTPQGAHVAPKGKASKTRATRKKTAARAARGAKKAKQATPKPPAPPASKKELVLALLRRPEGATLADIRNQTAWAAHSVRGFISTMGKKLGAPVESTRNAGGERLYRIV
jgi:hypothetical protein